ncbi:uncharacterized protein LOC111379363 [Olea europaea var. sylvestris]|uniref:uncharacterized protein LOC111379363 n=1 Tax=Olea europaea var. sylvestris TaxID=158386 RepID=UPI000C1CFAFA|nr:uncharacterized protein LOC111379363 [Olea europaea var. sylvestris]
MVNTRSCLPPASSSAPNQPPPEDIPVPQEESSKVPELQPAVVTTGAFEELRQQVATLTQLLSQKNSHPSPTQAPQGGFMADAQARAQRHVPNNDGVGASGIPHVTSALRSVTIESEELARIIQEGITAGLLQGNKGSARFSPSTPFTPEILTFPLPDRFKYPRIKEYDGTTDPINHLNVYTDVMNLQVAPNQVMCKAFPQTLTNAARGWFSILEPNSITSFSDLADKFSAFFASSKCIRKTVASLMQLRQGQNETLHDFMTRFNKERLQIPDLHITTAVSALTYAIKCKAFKMSLSKTPSKIVIELLTRAEQYINMEETLNPRKVGPSHDTVEHKRQHDLNPREEPPRRKQRQEVPSTSFTRLNTSKTNILMEIKDMKELKWPVRMRSPPESRDMNTNDKRLRNDHGREKAPEAKRDGQPTAGTINIIIGGIASGGDSNSGRKQYAQQYALASGMPHGKLEDITFGTRDLEGVSLPHDDALVISAIVANFEIKRILVDNGSAANILSQEAFAKMGISSQQLKAVKTPFQGFRGGVITPEGVVELPLTLGSG